jgi:hypothetical protein
MDTVPAPSPAFRRAVFEDALGLRHHADSPGGDPLEIFEVRERFDSESFERALRDRVTTLAAFHSTWFTQARTVQRVSPNNMSKLFAVYDRVPGTRLSSLLAAVPQPLEVNATLCLIRQLVAAIALLHEKLPALAHGAIATERVIITPKARLVVTDHALGSALERLRLSPDQYWNELGVPLPNDLEPTFDQRADVMQIGIVALELILGRRVRHEEYPVRIHELTDAAWSAAAASGKPLPPELRTWLLRMLQLDTEHAVGTAVEAWEDLEHVLIGSDNRASFMALEAVVAEYMRTPAMAPVPLPAPVPPPAFVKVSAPVVADTAPPAPAEEKRPAPEPVVPSPRIETPAPAHHSTEPFAAAAPPKSRRWLAVAALVALLVSGGAFVSRQYLVPTAVAEAPGTLVVATNPPGVPVLIDGQPRGVTPLSVELAPGSHELRLEAESGPRIIPVTVRSGGTVSQTLELPRVAPTTGHLSVRTEPPGARVSIDGVESGVTPLTIEDLEPGTHRVTLSSDLTSVTQDVSIEAGITAALVVPMTAPQGVPMSGWVTIVAPAEVHVFENGRLVGSSQSDRIMVTAGRHEFDILNDALGYHTRRVVTVAAGKVSELRLDWPMGTVAINAQPWADVFINGQRIGETPIGNHALPIGTHDVTFRHPQLGERVVRATVTTAAPARVSVDMRKP